jgi:hypothetical protein
VSQISCQKTCWKGYDGATAPRWNSKVESFVTWFVVQKEKNIRMMGVVEDYKPLWGVVRKGRCCCQFVLRLQERMDVDWP